MSLLTVKEAARYAQTKTFFVLAAMDNGLLEQAPVGTYGYPLTTREAIDRWRKGESK